jgi:Fe-S cluster assembly protein SufD
MSELATRLTESSNRLRGLGVGKIPKEPSQWTIARESALRRFSEQGLPTSRNEAWKYTNVLSFSQLPFVKPASTSANLSEKQVPFLSPKATARLVFSNGRYDAALSRPGTSPIVAPFASLLSDKIGSQRLEKYFGKAIPTDASAFSCLNEALFDDGAAVFIPAGFQSESPIELVFRSGPGSGPTAVTPRVVIVAEKGSKAKIVEQYCSEEDGEQLVDSLVEVFLEEEAELDLISLYRVNPQSFHVGSTYVSQAKGSRLKTRTFSFRGAVIRNELRVRLLGEGAECDLSGLMLGSGNQHLDTYTFIDHVVPHCKSRELYKCILSDKSTGVFFGRVRVEKDAQKTDSVQTNKNLVLSDESTMNTRPQLEIYADDVKCNHGAAIGQLDEGALFYLRSRGIDPVEAKQMLTYAFAAELVELIDDGEVRSSITKYLHEALKQ